MAKWFSVAAKSGGIGAIDILSDIGVTEGGVTASQFSRELQALGAVRELHIRISSNGGDVAQGFAIFNQLSRHAARKIVTIDGLAASMASVIAMAGDQILMPSNSMLMIHNPWGGVAGGSDEIISFGEALSKMRLQIADAYVKRARLSQDAVLAMMDRETWLSAEEAVELGLADRVIAPTEMAASIDISKFKKAPRSMFGASKGDERKARSLADLTDRAFAAFNKAGTQPKAKPEDENHDPRTVLED